MDRTDFTNGFGKSTASAVPLRTSEDVGFRQIGRREDCVGADAFVRPICTAFGSVEPHRCARNSSDRVAGALGRAIEQLRAHVGIGRENPELVSDPLAAALQARLESLEEEIDRVTRLASQERDIPRQEAYLGLARDLQRQAREIRKQIRLRSNRT